MSTFIHNFHFMRPLGLLAILLLPLLWRALRLYGNDAQVWRGAIDAHLLEHLLVRDQDAKPVRSPRWLIAAGWTLGCLALAGPSWERLPQPLYQNKAARVIALELAPTMLAQDVKPSRFERARYKIADILKLSGDTQTALITYSGDAFVVAPLTDDATTVANLVDSLDPSVMPDGGNDTGRAIDVGVRLIRQAGVHEGEIVLLADSASANATAAAARARSDGVRISVLGIGSAQGAPIALAQGGFLKDSTGSIILPKLDANALGALAAAGGGRYATFTGDGGDLSALIGRLKASDTPASASGAQVQSERWQDRGPWLLLALLPLAALGFRRGWLMLLPLALVGHSTTAQANVWDDLWQRPDQQAQAQLESGKAKEAQALAASPDLRGSAAYRAGDFAAASKDFESAAAAAKDASGAEAQYNRGNALAKQNQYKEALAAYDEALKLSPQMVDAQANKQAVEDFLKQQQTDKQNQKQDAKDHQGDKQQQPGNDEPQDGEQGRDEKPGERGKEGKDQKPADGKDQDGKDQPPQDGKDSSSDQQKSSDKPGNASKDKPGDEKSQAKPPNQGSEAGKDSQQQFEKSMDQALNKDVKPDPDKKPQPVRLGARAGEQRSEQNEAVEQWLQRVPDDPGGLLRRKFQLEYQRRHGGAQENSQ